MATIKDMSAGVQGTQMQGVIGLCSVSDGGDTSAEVATVEKESAPEGAVGHRVARQRKLSGLTQLQLATRAHVSKSLVSQVEQGAVPASATFTAAVARVLGVDVDALTGQPYGLPITDPRAEHAGIPALRMALDCEEDPELNGWPMTPAELRARLDGVDWYRAGARYSQMAAVLPELLQHAYRIAEDARPGAESETACALLDDAYRCVHTVSYRFGYFDLAALAGERSRQAAARSGDPLRMTTATQQRSSLRLHRGDYPGALRMMERAHREIATELSPAADAVRAQLHLRQSLVHARTGAADRADEHIDAARELVARGIPAHPYYNVRASAANVDIHWVRVAVERSDAITAVGRAEQIDIPEDLEPTRAGRHWIDLARAWTLHRNRANALDALIQARAIAPQRTRYSPEVHETVHLLAETSRRANDSLAGFARWAGVRL